MNNQKKIVTKEIDKQLSINLVKKYSKYQINDKNSNVYFAFLLNDVRVTIYKTFKIVFQGNNAQDVYNLVLNPLKTTLNESNKNLNLQTLTKLSKNHLFEIGSDEVGVGDYFGGISVCAVLLNEQDKAKLRNFKIVDSKELNDLQIITKAKQIIDAKIKYQIETISPTEYNKIFDKYENAHKIKTYLHNKALLSLFKKYDINRNNCLVVMDQFAAKKNYEKYLQEMNLKEKVDIDLFETKGESKYLSIASASILARNDWLNSIKKLELNLGHKIYLGSSNYNVINLAQAIYNKQGINGLKQYVKLHFSFTNKILNNKN